MIIAYNNLVDDAIITALVDSPAATMSDGLKDPRLSRVGRLLDIAGQSVSFDLGVAKQADIVTIFGHNLTSLATVRIQGNATDTWGSPTVDELVPISDNIAYRFTGGSFRYWRLSIEDPTNLNSFLTIGGMYLGEYQTAPGISADPIFSVSTTSTAEFSRSGHLFGNSGIDYNVFSVVFPRVTAAEKIRFESLFFVVNIIKPFYMVMFESEPFTVEPQYVVLVSNFEYQKIAQDGSLWTVGATMREVK